MVGYKENLSSVEGNRHDPRETKELHLHDPRDKETKLTRSSRHSLLSSKSDITCISSNTKFTSESL